jgi:hypothetical protein
MATVPHPPEGEFFRVVFEREKEKLMVDLWPRCLSLQASRPRPKFQKKSAQILR